MQSSLWGKINLDPLVKWRGLDTYNVHSLFMEVGLHVCGSWNITKHYKRKQNNYAMPSIKSLFLSHGSGFFP